MAQRLICIAVVYLVIGASLGIYMGIAQNFTLLPVHVHTMLAGWLSLAMAGAVYRLYPAAAETRLAKWHFWLHNLGLPAFMVGLAAHGLGYDMFALLAGGATVLLAGFICFAVNALLKVRDQVVVG